MANLQEIESLIDDVASFIDSGDFTSAKRKLLIVEAKFLTIPLESSKGGNAGNSMNFRETLLSLRQQISAQEREQSSTDLIQNVPMQYTTNREVL